MWKQNILQRMRNMLSIRFRRLREHVSEVSYEQNSPIGGEKRKQKISPLVFSTPHNWGRKLRRPQLEIRFLENFRMHLMQRCSYMQI